MIPGLSGAVAQVLDLDASVQGTGNTKAVHPVSYGHPAVVQDNPGAIVIEPVATGGEIVGDIQRACAATAAGPSSARSSSSSLGLRLAVRAACSEP